MGSTNPVFWNVLVPQEGGSGGGDVDVVVIEVLSTEFLWKPARSLQFLIRSIPYIHILLTTLKLLIVIRLPMRLTIFHVVEPCNSSSNYQLIYWIFVAEKTCPRSISALSSYKSVIGLGTWVVSYFMRKESDGHLLQFDRLIIK